MVTSMKSTFGEIGAATVADVVLAVDDLLQPILFVFLFEDREERSLIRWWFGVWI